VVENIVRLCIKKRFVFRRVVAASIAVKAILTDMKDARAEIWILDTYKGNLKFKFLDIIHLLFDQCVAATKTMVMKMPKTLIVLSLYQLSFNF
jgi:hypothetical protein